MGDRTSYEPGAFCWTDLATSDPEGAKAFYGGLFGWQAEDMPAGEGMTYTMLSLGGRYVGALYQGRPEQGPPAWLSYVSVADAAATAARAAELGGAVVQDALDVFDSGRMAVLQDPQGAVFALWQPREHPGAGLVNDPGSMTWNQLDTTDVDGAIGFYGELLGWTVDEVEGSPQRYATIRNAGRMNGGIMAMPEPAAGAPPHWMSYFTVEDAEAALTSAEQLGGQTVVPPTRVPAGRFAVVRDPQGAYFALFEGEVEP